MPQEPVRDRITISDEQGNEKEFYVEALFNMDDEDFAIISSSDETLLMKVEGKGDEQYLVGISNPDKRDAILDAYQIAMEAADEDENRRIH